MPPFRLPNAEDSIWGAIRDTRDPNSSENGDKVVQLLNENNRAIEDAITNINTTPNFQLLSASVQAGTAVGDDWTLPGSLGSKVYAVSLSVVADDLPSDAKVWIGATSFISGAVTGPSEPFISPFDPLKTQTGGTVTILCPAGLTVYWAIYWESASFTPQDFGVTLMAALLG